MGRFSLFPERASTFAGDVDALYFFLVGVSVFFATLIASLVIFLALRYRRRSRREQGLPVHESLALELAWTIVPLVLVFVIFAWGAIVFFDMSTVPEGAMEISVVGKRWMWKIQHSNGRREINELHVPKGMPVKLTLTSEDVIHSFYVPAFRIKKDVLPGHYVTTWFEATKTGDYHLFCAEYCGTGHSAMIGTVVVMEPSDFQTWLAGETPASPVDIGRRLFGDNACATCHQTESTARGPSLPGILGRRVQLSSGETIVADEVYLRESIVNPTAKVVAGYQPIMPTYKGILSEGDIINIVAYLRSLKATVDEGPTAITEEGPVNP